jgi:hypothetical protein
MGMSRTEINLTDIADDPENIELVTESASYIDEWIICIGDLQLTMRADQILRLHKILSDNFGDVDDEA